MHIKIKELNREAKIPEYKTEGASGMDLYACSNISIMPRKIGIIHTGIALEIPREYEGQIRSRSGLACKGVVVANAPGTIDSDYRGEIMVILINHGDSIFDVIKGDRIAQLVFCKVKHPHIDLVNELSETPRGTGGFGSTGANDEQSE